MPSGTSFLRRDSLLGAMDELVRSNGWAATSLAKVAKRAGVSRQTVYNKFGSRQSIAEAYVVYRFDELLDACAETIRAHGDDMETGLRSALDIVFDVVDEPLIQTALAGGGIGSEELAGLLKVTNVRATSKIGELLCEVRPSISESESVVLADCLARVALTHAISPFLPRQEAIDRMIRMAMVFLGPTPG